jgi:pathogenesis-related protein 1
VIQTCVRVFADSKAGRAIASFVVCVLGCAAVAECFGSVQGSQNREEMPKQMLEAHNRIRRSHGVEPLAWSDALAGYAKSWANRLASEGRLHHHPNPKYGENLYLISGGEASPAEVVDSWASESKDYDYKSNSCRSRCGHYTQIVWRDSKEVGCGVGRSGNTEVWVCEYNPPGNVVGERPY